MKESIGFSRSAGRRSRILLLWLAIFSGIWSPTSILAVVGAQEQPEETKLDLESMTQAELELICVERGFELIQDNESGEELTHADYVDAARRCLAIEEDMNEILEQNPELADELLSEIDRMKDEKEQLEKERQRMLAQKEELEQQLLEKTKTSSASATTGGSGESLGRWGAGPPTASSSPQPKQSASPVSSSNVDAAEKNGENDILIEDTKLPSGNITAEEQEGRTDSTDDDLCMPTATEPTTKQSDPTRSTAETKSDSTAATAEDTSDKSTDFSLKSFIQEFVKEFERDVHRITALMLPVVKPMLDAGNFAWKYVKIMFHGAKRQMEKYKAQQQEQEQPKQSGEGSDDTK